MTFTICDLFIKKRKTKFQEVQKKKLGEKTNLFFYALAVPTVNSKNYQVYLYLLTNKEFSAKF